jgi:hypothetical protein
MTRLHSAFVSGKAILFVSFVNQTMALAADEEDGTITDQTSEYIANPDCELIVVSSDPEMVIHVYDSSIYILDSSSRTKLSHFVPSSRILDASIDTEHIYCFDEKNIIHYYRVNTQDRLVEEEQTIQCDSVLVCLHAVYSAGYGRIILKQAYALVNIFLSGL